MSSMTSRGCSIMAREERNCKSDNIVLKDHRVSGTLAATAGMGTM